MPALPRIAFPQLSQCSRVEITDQNSAEKKAKTIQTKKNTYTCITRSENQVTTSDWQKKSTASDCKNLQACGLSHGAGRALGFGPVKSFSINTTAE